MAEQKKDGIKLSDKQKIELITKGTVDGIPAKKYAEEYRKKKGLADEVVKRRIKKKESAK